MKFIILLTILEISTSLIKARSISDEWQVFDFSQALPIEHTPGFIDNKIVPQFLQENGKNRRIFGGQEVVPNSHPYQVALLLQLPAFTSVCGGSIIHSRASLTAAHCVQNAISTIVVAGAHDRTQFEPTQQRITSLRENYRIHPGWNNNFADDIAIVILPSAFNFDSFVTPIRLPFGLEMESFVGERSRVVGWGITNDGTGPSNVLREAFNTIITNDECTAVYGSLITPSILCTSTIGQGACSSDSGGTLTVTRGGDSQPIQVGVVAFGPACGTEIPTGFERVTSHLEWIVANQVP